MYIQPLVMLSLAISLQVVSIVYNKFDVPNYYYEIKNKSIAMGVQNSLPNWFTENQDKLKQISEQYQHAPYMAHMLAMEVLVNANHADIDEIVLRNGTVHCMDIESGQMNYDLRVWLEINGQILDIANSDNLRASEKLGQAMQYPNYDGDTISDYELNDNVLLADGTTLNNVEIAPQDYIFGTELIVNEFKPNNVKFATLQYLENSLCNEFMEDHNNKTFTTIFKALESGIEFLLNKKAIDSQDKNLIRVAVENYLNTNDNQTTEITNWLTSNTAPFPQVKFETQSLSLKQR